MVLVGRGSCWELDDGADDEEETCWVLIVGKMLDGFILEA